MTKPRPTRTCGESPGGNHQDTGIASRQDRRIARKSEAPGKTRRKNTFPTDRLCLPACLPYHTNKHKPTRRLIGCHPGWAALARAFYIPRCVLITHKHAPRLLASAPSSRKLVVPLPYFTDRDRYLQLNAVDRGQDSYNRHIVAIVGNVRP